MANSVLRRGGCGLPGHATASMPHNVHHRTPPNTGLAKGHLLFFSLKKKIALVFCLFELLILDSLHWVCQGKHTDRHGPPWPGTIVTICMSCFTKGGPGKAHGTSEPPPTRRVQERKEIPHVRPSPRIILTGIHLGWTGHALPGRTLSQNDWLKTTQKLIPSP